MDQDIGRRESRKLNRFSCARRSSAVICLQGKASWITTLTIGIVAVLLCGTNSAHAVDGPSFDCSRGVNSALAIILCDDSNAAKADWDLNVGVLGEIHRR